jgi:hypothetical protein
MMLLSLVNDEWQKAGASEEEWIFFSNVNSG